MHHDSFSNLKYLLSFCPSLKYIATNEPRVKYGIYRYNNVISKDNIRMKWHKQRELRQRGHRILHIRHMWQIATLCIWGAKEQSTIPTQKLTDRQV